MVDLIKIFENQPEKYDLLVTKEDYKNNLLKKIIEISNLNENLTVLDLGTGTGRISFLLADYVKQIYAFDRTEAMIHFANKKLKLSGKENIKFDISDSTHVPLRDHYVDLSIEGWAFLAMKLFSDQELTELLKNGVNEMERVTEFNGDIILIETAGTCVDEPLDYFLPQLNILTDELGFKKEIIETPYKFDTIEQALDLIKFFFGEEAYNWTKKNNSEIVKEFTGIWWKKNI